MKNILRYAFLLLGLALLIPTVSHAQRGGKGQNLAKVDQLEKVRLLDILQMNDETSIKFFNRRREFKEKQRQIGEQSEAVINELEGILKSKTADKEVNKLKKLNDELLKLESQRQKQRLDYLTSLSDLLTPEQVAKLAVFERDFRKEIRDALSHRRQSEKD